MKKIQKVRLQPAKKLTDIKKIRAAIRRHAAREKKGLREATLRETREKAMARMVPAVWPTFEGQHAIPGTWTNATETPLADVEKATKAVRSSDRFKDEAALEPPTLPDRPAIPGVIALIGVLDATIERLEHRLSSVLRPDEEAGKECVADSVLARQIERSVIDLNDIIERIDV